MSRTFHRNGRKFRLVHYWESQDILVVVKEFEAAYDEEHDMHLEGGAEEWRFHAEVDDLAHPVTTFPEAGGGVDYSGQNVSEDMDVWSYVQEELDFEIEYLGAQ